MKAAIIVIVLLVIVVMRGSMYRLNEGRQAIITQFGKPIGEPITKPGLHFKIPFTQEIRLVDKRILNWDGIPEQMATKDKKFIKVDTTARWRIVDTLKFIQTVRNQRGAKARLDTILDSATRQIISKQNLVEAVRNTNLILDNIEKKKLMMAKNKKAGTQIIEEEVFGEIEKINIGRDHLSQQIVTAARGDLAGLGIELIDVQLRRISYERSVEAKVYERMVSERQRIAQKIRSVGQGEKAKIEGRIEWELKGIQSEAYKKAQIVRGKAEAKATDIYARSLRGGANFYAFIRSMEAYKKSLKGSSNFLLSSDSEFLKYMQSDK